AFTNDLCRLLQASGCIAVTGGLETCNDRILKLMNKKISVKESVSVLNNFSKAGIMVHTYLIYGFPSETSNEAINSLEIVRQLFKNGTIHSAYYHRFALTIHSEIYKNPENYNVKPVVMSGDFANNDVFYNDLNNSDVDKIGDNLNKALYNFNYSNLLSNDIKSWFDTKNIAISVDKNYVKNIINESQEKDNGELLWIGNSPYLNKNIFTIPNYDEDIEYELPSQLAKWLLDIIDKVDIKKNKTFEKIKLSDIEKTFPLKNDSFAEFLKNELWFEIRKSGLLIC
ncbi:MAG TPA: radical SAM protein, partial [Spirochaetota bacterium]|nr:radical SAM protein [Spirochaetota bacterium]